MIFPSKKFRDRKFYSLATLVASSDGLNLHIKNSPPEQAEALRQILKAGKYSSKVALAKAFNISPQAVLSIFKTTQLIIL